MRLPLLLPHRVLASGLMPALLLVGGLLPALLLVMTACGKSAPPQEKPAVPQAPSTAPAAPAVPTPTGQPAAAEPVKLVDLPPEPMQLPAGQTLGDALPPLPALPPRVGHGAVAAEIAPEHTCENDATDGQTLVKHMELQLAPTKADAPAGVLQVCLFQQLAADRPDKVGDTGRRFTAVAVWPDDKRVQTDVAALVRPPTRLPPERVKSGHDANGWASLIATGDPRQPVLLVVSGRFYDGELGEEVHFARRAKVLAQDGAGPHGVGKPSTEPHGVGKPSTDAWTWQPGLERAFSVTDFAHLHALCAGRADASPADRAAGALQAACDRAEKLEADREAQVQARADTRKKRLAGATGGKANDDADPQSIWLRDAKAALAKGDGGKAIALALQVDTVCGEASTEAHALVREALAAAKVDVQRVQPAQATAELCEPLVDKPAPKRPRVDLKPPAAKPSAAKPPVRPKK